MSFRGREGVGEARINDLRTQGTPVLGVADKVSGAVEVFESKSVFSSREALS